MTKIPDPNLLARYLAAIEAHPVGFVLASAAAVACLVAWRTGAW